MKMKRLFRLINDNQKIAIYDLNNNQWIFEDEKYKFKDKSDYELINVTCYNNTLCLEVKKWI